MTVRAALPVRRWTRVLMGTLVAIISVVLASASHIAAGGHQPGLLGIGLAVALSIPLCMILVGRRYSLPRTAIAVGFSQLLLHLLFSLEYTRSAADASGVLGGAHQHGAAMLMPMTPQESSVAAAAAGAMGVGDPWMWVAHITTGLLTLGMLRIAHRAIRLLLLLARPWRAVRAALVVPVAQTYSRPIVAGVFALRAITRWRLCIGALSRRGPPAFGF